MAPTPLKILVVEDEYITQKTICNYLTEIGYEVVTAVMNANNAIEILNTKNVDFAILDINIKGEKKRHLVRKLYFGKFYPSSFILNRLF